MNWKLYLDDEQTPMESGWVVAKSTIMAVVFCVQNNELPSVISLDHKLSDGDSPIRFLKELRHIWETRGSDLGKIPKYVIHSIKDEKDKTVQDIISYMESWKNTVKE